MTNLPVTSSLTESDAAEYDLLSSSLSPAGPGGVSRRSPSRARRLILAMIVLVAAFAFLAIKGLGGSLNYFETVDQALAHKATLGTQTFRLEGVVVPGSVHRSRDVVDFVASGSKGNAVAVVNTGNPPQLFQPDIPVVVVGHFEGSTFYSNQIIVDHTSNYIEAHPQRVRAPNGTTR
jgi:cytochrome c-type biogenesis protein CcmE